MGKPFDIRERTFVFACDIVAAFPRERPLALPAYRIWNQLLAAGTSVGAHLEEADAASSRAHLISLNRGALRELREARYWLRLIAAARLSNHERTASLLDESNELIAILCTIVKRASARRS